MSSRVFTRDLPGGGYVAIEIDSRRSLLHPRRLTGHVIVERRADVRRDGHAAPRVAVASGNTVEDVMQQLLPVAESNAAIGAALLRMSPVKSPTFDTAHAGHAMSESSVGTTAS